MEIKQDDLSNGEVISLLEEHLRDMYTTSPAESVHALDLTALKSPEITFFSAWIDNKLAGCVAIRRLNSNALELKSMRTSTIFRGKGVASKLLLFVLNFAKNLGYTCISLETGSQAYFAPARSLYKKYNFVDCEPFSDYTLDPSSKFMTRKI
jgi:putative acetyltransferase